MRALRTRHRGQAESRAWASSWSERAVAGEQEAHASGRAAWTCTTISTKSVISPLDQSGNRAHDGRALRSELVATPAPDTWVKDGDVDAVDHHDQLRRTAEA